MNIWVARQPILDRKQRLYGYELLFRTGSESDQFDGISPASATTQVVANTLLGIGLEHLVPRGRAFINLDRDMLLGGLSSIFPRERVVFELLETIEADEEVLAACVSLQRQGWLLALDDFIPRAETEPLTSFAKIIKVDIQTIDRTRQEQMVAAYHVRGIHMLAEKVETREEFQWALNAGYDLFQGYFFARPALVPGRQIPVVKAACLNLLREVQAPDLNFTRVESLIAGDVALSWQLLRFVNSAGMAHRAEICSVRHALSMLGEDHIRQWAALATMAGIAKDKPDELLTLSLVRAHFCQYLAELGNIPQTQDAFLTGLLSLIDTLLDMPLEAVLKNANVSPSISAALLQTAPEADLLRTLTNLVLAWEQGNWELVSRYAARLSVPAAIVGEAYRESLLWASRALQGAAARMYSRRRQRCSRNGAVTLKVKTRNGKKRTVIATLVDISPRGLRLLSSEAIACHTPVLCETAGSGTSQPGSVRYCNSEPAAFSIGVEFGDATDGRYLIS